MKRASPLSVLVGVVIIAAMPMLLLRSMFSDFGSGAATVWLNPKYVAAGFGFAGLALALAIAAIVHLVRKLPWDQGSGLLAGVIIAGGLGGWGASRPLVSWWAHRHGYERCEAQDRFQAGNIRRNDVTLHAWCTSPVLGQ
ncbi:MAG: hypothetical protein GQE15_16890 [Archangiaceae bacterium]|nr:hypothetical protein [Archangiaceae bacterium]